MPRLPKQCMHIMVSGAHCGSPALRQAAFCYYHKRQRQRDLRLNAERARSARILPFTLPVLEDAQSIQAALAQVYRLLAAGEIEHKTASLMLYALQIATSTLPSTSDQLP